MSKIIKDRVFVMGEVVLELGNEELKKIGEYVQSHINDWVHGSNIIDFKTNREIELLERMVRVEEELKNQRELMNLGFTAMDKRFEAMQIQIDKRFDQVEKRFEQVDKRFESFESRFNRITVLITIGFITMATLISVYQFLA